MYFGDEITSNAIKRCNRLIYNYLKMNICLEISQNGTKMSWRNSTPATCFVKNVTMTRIAVPYWLWNYYIIIVEKESHKRPLKRRTLNSHFGKIECEKCFHHADCDTIFDAENANCISEFVFLKGEYPFFGQHPISLRASYHIDDLLIRERWLRNIESITVSYRTDDSITSHRSQCHIILLLYVYDTYLPFETLHLMPSSRHFITLYLFFWITICWLWAEYIVWWRMTLFAVLKVVIGNDPHEISQVS